MISGKNWVRALVAFGSALGPRPSTRTKSVYISLRATDGIGGPNRFLRNLTDVLREQGVGVSNWNLKGCEAALVFSASWGNSFTWLCRKLGVRSVLRVDGFYVPELFGPGQKYPLTDYQNWVNERLQADLERFDQVIYQSAFAKEQADLHLYHRSKAYTIIHNGVDTKFFRPQQASGNSHSNCPTIILVGNHLPEHITLALDVFRRIRTTQQARLLIVGPMRDRAENAATFVAQYLAVDSLIKDVVCLSTVPYEKLPGVLAQGDLFLHVKVGDSCPNAVLEALACGLPVVCPAWGGTRELVGTGGIAVEGPPWSVDDPLRDGMAKAVLQILADRKEYSLGARRVAEENHRKEIAAEKYLMAMKTQVEVE